MRRFLFGLAVTAILGLPSAGLAQFRGGGPDANQIWVMMAGSDVPSIDLNQRTDIRERIQKRGGAIPANGILTKEAFVADFQQRMAQGGGFGGGGGMGGGGAMTDDQIKGFMQRSDKNGDGRITLEEASDRLRPDFARFDKNSDGAVDTAEYRVYIEERFGQRNRDRDGKDGGNAVAPPGFAPPQPQYAPPERGDRDRRDERKAEDEVARPTVFRFGKLPKELPSWFEKLDTDADGQLGLYEWRTASRPTTEFVEMDQNGDGYLTAEEWLRFTKSAIEAKPSADAVAASSDGGKEKSRDDRGDRGGKNRGGNPFTGGK
ncbi:MAG: hypothetical protein ACRC7O_15955 [Fimbriiglobus sp.]